MAGKEEKINDLYAVLGLKKECTETELKNAYKKLALRWHPDRCSAPEAKKKFQSIQEAYSVLSDANKRFLYDVGVYNDDDEENGMGEFMNEMAAMMTQTKPNENGKESFEQLQELFKEMFQGDVESFYSSSSCESFPSLDMNSRRATESSGSNAYFDVEYQEKRAGKGASGGGGRRQRRKQKVSARNDFSM